MIKLWVRFLLVLLPLVWCGSALPSQQMYEPMAESVRLAFQSALRDGRAPYPVFDSAEHRIDWLGEMSRRLSRKVQNFKTRVDLIKIIRYEAQRVGIDPQLVFAVIEVDHRINKNDPEVRW